MNVISVSQPKEKVAVHIDGNNFYGYLKDEAIRFPKDTKFNYSKFVEWLAGDRDREISREEVAVIRQLVSYCGN